MSKYLSFNKSEPSHINKMKQQQHKVEHAQRRKKNTLTACLDHKDKGHVWEEKEHLVSKTEAELRECQYQNQVNATEAQ